MIIRNLKMKSRKGMKIEKVYVKRGTITVVKKRWYRVNQCDERNKEKQHTKDFLKSCVVCGHAFTTIFPWKMTCMGCITKPDISDREATNEVVLV